MGIKVKDHCVYYSDADKAASLETPPIGPNGTVVGNVTFPDGWDGKGMYSNAIGDNVVVNDPSFINPNKYCIGIKAITDFSVVNGVPSDATNHVPYHWANDINNFSKWLILSTAHIIQHRVNGGFYSIFSNANINWNAGEVVTLHFVFDRDGIDAGPITHKFFINKVEVISSPLAVPIQSLTGTEFSFLDQPSIAGDFPFAGVIDDPKIFVPKVGNFTTPLIEAILANSDVPGFPEDGSITNSLVTIIVKSLVGSLS